MAKLVIFNFTTLNGYFKGPGNDTRWHKHGEEEGRYAAEAMNVGPVILLFGRITYEMMAGYWPTPMALESAPDVAKGMNSTQKIVFSRTLQKAGWQNTRLVKTDVVDEIKKLKKGNTDMTVLGSGTLVTQLADAGLIDEYQFMIDPVALGDGTPTFKGLRMPLNLTHTKTHTFKSGVVLLCYAPEKK
ncbi:dihydrofolate reductase family protein [Chryseolinea lacunae]|uniref:Dihydrofolate reductase family protein n=1 Tax=Chryseolinea lacunae TaxID=2801331 RepID=A0ABS1KZ73_9BACT|nr:dihydrofolate reductase family protein [Chryseolinea lacunae]MBL0744572.1 dihydrofolate reductase family protein [Chryseolinea lacunae]